MTRKSLRTANRVSGRGKNPRSLANLEAHKFPPGVSGNPGGRPKVLGQAYKEWLAEFDEKTGLTRAQSVAMAIGKAALGGDVSAARELRSATEATRVEVTGAGGGAIKVDDLDAIRKLRWERAARALAAAQQADAQPPKEESSA